MEAGGGGNLDVNATEYGIAGKCGLTYVLTTWRLVGVKSKNEVHGTV